MPYVELQKLLDEANAWGIHGYEKGTYVEELSDPVIDVITEQIPYKNSPMSVLLFYRLDGAYCQAGDDETAFSGGRSPRYGVFIVGLAPDAGLLDADRGWVRGFWEALRPHAIGSGDGYINGITDFSDDRVRQSYGQAKYERLARIKAQYDPGNLFHLNANIKPASPGTSVWVREPACPRRRHGWVHNTRSLPIWSLRSGSRVCRKVIQNRISRWLVNRLGGALLLPDWPAGAPDCPAGALPPLPAFWIAALPSPCRWDR